jgi:hypothetical protein
MTEWYWVQERKYFGTDKLTGETAVGVVEDLLEQSHG